MTRLRSNKEIHLLRLMVIAGCNLACRYCFVRKDGRKMSYAAAAAAVKLLLSSPGRDKVLIIYGGEPLLYYGMTKKIILLAKKEAEARKKRLVISLGTNGTLLDRGRLEFFHKAGVKLAVSLDGREEFHDKARFTKNNKGSFRAVAAKLPLILEHTAKGDLCILFGVLPSSVRRMSENLEYIFNLGFDSVNIEPVLSPDFPWSAEQAGIFAEEMREAVSYIYRNIRAGRFLFLNTTNRELAFERLSSWKKICPFYDNLDVYPRGEIGFSPILLSAPGSRNYEVGNIRSGLPAAYASCLFSPDDGKCRDCWRDYSSGTPRSPEAEAVEKARNNYSLYLARQVRARAPKDRAFGRYLLEAKKRIFE